MQDVKQPQLKEDVKQPQQNSPLSSKALDASRPQSSSEPPSHPPSRLTEHSPLSTTSPRPPDEPSQIKFSRETKFFYTVGKERKGPSDLDGLKQLFSQGIVTSSAYIWYKEIGKQWIRLREDTQLLEHLTA